MGCEELFDYESMETDRLEWLLCLNAEIPKGGGLSDAEFAHICSIIALRKGEKTGKKPDASS